MSLQGKAIQNYRELKVWELGMDLTVAVYQLTAQYPGDERFGITSQMRRCASSIPANIAEGQGRDSTKDFVRHLSYAIGSAKELETFLLLSKRLGYGMTDRIDLLLEQLDEEGRMLRGLQQSLKRRLTKNSHP